MTIEIFTLCDAANTDGSGKISLLGSFDRINALQPPIVHPLCALAVKLRFKRIEEGLKQIRISIIDSDGRSVMPTLNTQVLVQFPIDEPTATVQLTLTIQQIKLPNFGEYSIGLAVDGDEKASIPLYARQIEIPPQPQIPAPETPHPE